MQHDVSSRISHGFVKACSAQMIFIGTSMNNGTYIPFALVSMVIAG